MAERSIPREISDAASRWVTARDAGSLTEHNEHELALWLAADPLHARAYAEVEDVWEKAGGEQFKAALRQRYGNTIPSQPRRSARLAPRWAGPALAASLALVMIGSAYDWQTRLRADVLTETGQRKAVKLSDGSVIQLNTGSAIDIDYGESRRVIRLLKGEAAFTVAPDRTRPFTVEADGGSTTALGTRFLVRSDGNGVDVKVTEHRVRVAGPLATTEMLDLDAGEAARYGSAGISAVRHIDADTADAWTRGVLLFVDRPLGEVAAELNRYHPGLIRVIGEDLAARRVSGGFRTDDPLGAIDDLQRTLHIGSTRVTDRLIFLHE